jgi:hypothetical protein
VDWKWSSLPDYLGQVRKDWLYRKEVLGLLGVQPPRKWLEFLSQAPILSKEILYPRESLVVMGERSFVLEVTQPGEWRRKQPRVYAGRMLPWQQLAEIFCRAAGLTLDAMYILHKGSRQHSKLRDQIIYVAPHLMYNSVSELSRFLKIIPAAVTISNRRFMENIRLNPRQQDRLTQLLTKNS